MTADLSQRQLSFPGCSPAYISRIEAGDRIPSLQLLREMGRRLGVSEDYLATGADRPPNDEPRVLLEGELALRLDEPETAERMFRQALEEAATKHERARALAGLGQLFYRRGDLHEAIGYLGDSIAVRGGKAEDDPSLADTLGRAYALTGAMASAIEVFERSLAAAEERGDKIETIRFAVLLANARVDRGEFAEAEELLRLTLVLARETRDPILRARLYWSQSRLHAEKGDAARSARYARKALQILELTEHTYYTARAHQLAAFVELERNRPEEALELLHRGWPLIAESGNPLERAQFRLEEARALAQLGRNEEAAAIAMEASGMLADTDPEDAGRGYGLIAEVFAALGDKARARELFELAAEKLELNPNRFLLDVYAKLAELLEDEGRKEDALEVLKKAVAIRTTAGPATSDPR